MLLSSIIQSLLSNQDVPYRLVDSANPENLAQTHASMSFLKDPLGIVVAIYNNGHQFDLLTLKALIERPALRFMSIEELEETLLSLKNIKSKPFDKTSASKHKDSNIQLIIDDPMSSQSTVLLVTDDPARRIQVDIWDMQIMIENALIGGIFSHKNNDKNSLAGNMNSNLLEQLKNIDHLPVMPTIAAKLLELHAKPEGTVDDMVRIISHDPALTAQILRYANSALFGFSGQINNLQDAIFRVLSYETVLYMSFGAALGRAFKLPQTGRLGMSTFWKEATYTAALCQQLALHMPIQSRPPAAITYITGLLHNIGLVIMGNLFQTEFDWLNKMLTSRPEQSLITTEQNLFGCTHATIGQHLMQHWNMPEEITAVVAEHHNIHYNGKQATYVWLTQLAGQALSAHGLSDSDEKVISEELCLRLGLSEADVEDALAAIMGENTALDAMADTLCA
ncbi:MAG: HDOD domain-containing protein [Gammaproteobacteria bacterium]|nr:HDOD domain-containing protein [Gammaproteobacteria bacterium]